MNSPFFNATPLSGRSLPLHGSDLDARCDQAGVEALGESMDAALTVEWWCGGEPTFKMCTDEP